MTFLDAVNQRAVIIEPLLFIDFPPQLLKSRRVGCGVPDGVLNVPVAAIMLIVSSPGILRCWSVYGWAFSP